MHTEWFSLFEKTHVRNTMCFLGGHSIYMNNKPGNNAQCRLHFVVPATGNEQKSFTPEKTCGSHQHCSVFPFQNRLFDCTPINEDHHKYLEFVTLFATRHTLQKPLTGCNTPRVITDVSLTHTWLSMHNFIHNIHFYSIQRT